MADMPSTPTPDAPPPVAAPPPPPPAMTPAAAAAVPGPGPQRWLIPIVAGIATSMLVQFLAAQVGLASGGILLPVVLGLVAGIFVAGRLAKVTNVGGWVIAGLLVFFGQIAIGLIIINLLLR